MSIIQELPTQQAAIYEALFCKGDVAIETLYAVLTGGPAIQTRTAQQQHLGPYIVRLNRRLAKHRLAVKPGDLKGTYALKSI